jgi:hypothetical protein
MASNIFLLLGAVSSISLILYIIGMMCGEPNHIDSKIEMKKFMSTESRENED